MGDALIVRRYHTVQVDDNSMATCTEETSAAYHATMQEIIAEIRNGAWLMSRTQHAFQTMMALAESMRIIP